MVTNPSQTTCKQVAERTPVGGCDTEEPPLSVTRSDHAFSISFPLLCSLLSLSRVSSSIGNFNVSVPCAFAWPSEGSMSLQGMGPTMESE